MENLREVAVAELRGMPSLPPEDFDQRVEIVAILPHGIGIDRNRVTGGGATAGIDFGLTLLARIFGEQAAKVTQLLMEYDPAPPVQSESPQQADKSTVATALEIMATTARQSMEALQRRRSV